MKALALAALVAFTVTAPAGDARAADDATITIAVSSFRNAHGLLVCQLYDSGVGFPDRLSSNKAFNQHVRVVAASSTECTFTVPPGTYAAMVLHDENANNRLDLTVFGMPAEGYGASNNHTHALRRPTWEESKFDAAPGEHVRLPVTLRY